MIDSTELKKILKEGFARAGLSFDIDSLVVDARRFQDGRKTSIKRRKPPLPSTKIGTRYFYELDSVQAYIDEMILQHDKPPALPFQLITNMTADELMNSFDDGETVVELSDNSTLVIGTMYQAATVLLISNNKTYFIKTKAE